MRSVRVSSDVLQIFHHHQCAIYLSVSFIHAELFRSALDVSRGIRFISRRREHLGETVAVVCTLFFIFSSEGVSNVFFVPALNAHV